MNIAILMMQKNEKDLLEPWIKYHADLFGAENLYIYDNGSTDEEVISILKKYGDLGISVEKRFSSKEDFENKGEIFSRKIKDLDGCGFYDFYFPLDCDEFIACKSDDGVLSVGKKEIEQELKKYLDERRVLAIGCAYDNSPVHADEYLPQPNQRKCFFVKNTCLSLDLGFHEGKAVTTSEKIKTSIVYFHFHHKPYQKYINSAKEKLKGRVPNFSREALLEHQENKGAGFHLISRLFMNQAEFNSQFSLKNRVRFDGVRKKLADVGAPLDLLDKEFDISSLNISKRNIRGYLDKVYVVDSSVEFLGWCLNEENKGCDEIIVEINNEVIDYYDFRKISRPDVVVENTGAVIDCGFKLKIPMPDFNLRDCILSFKVKKSDGGFQDLKMGKSIIGDWKKIIEDGNS